MNRPIITEFMGDEFTINKAHQQYLENLELWKYVQSLDKYADYLEEIQPRWISVKEKMPEPQKRVYVLCELEYNNKITRFQTIAEYIPYMTIKEEDYMDSDYEGDGDYNEEDDDEFYVKEGFYEWQIEADINFRITAKVIGWMPLFEI